MSSNWGALLNHKDYEVEFFGANLLVKSDVFSPDQSLTYSPSIIIENVGDVRGKTIADIGTGTGAIAVVCALRGARKVTATDISNVAVENAIINVKNNNVENLIEVVNTSVLDGVTEQFDIMCANLPILDDVWERKKVEPLVVIDDFLKQANKNLLPGGKILIPWASFAEKNRGRFEELVAKYNFNFSVIENKKIGFTWYLYVLSQSF